MTALRKTMSVAVSVLAIVVVFAAVSTEAVAQEPLDPPPVQPGPIVAETGILYDGPALGTGIAYYMVFRGPPFELDLPDEYEPPIEEPEIPRPNGTSENSLRASQGLGAYGGAGSAGAVRVGGQRFSPQVGVSVPNSVSAKQLVSQLKAIQDQLGL